MEINKLVLTKEELPILHNNCFQIPIHPKLLDSALKLNPEIAKNIFPEVAEEWRKDLQAYLPFEKDEKNREWYENVFLKKEKIKTKYGRQYFGVWEDDIQTLDNGFVWDFSISRNAGGSLYFNEEEFSCEAFFPKIKRGNLKIKTKEFGLMLLIMFINFQGHYF